MQETADLVNYLVVEGLGEGSEYILRGSPDVEVRVDDLGGRGRRRGELGGEALGSGRPLLRLKGKIWEKGFGGGDERRGIVT